MKSSEKGEESTKEIQERERERDFANKISSSVKRSRSRGRQGELTRGLLGGERCPGVTTRKYDETIFRAGSGRMLEIRCEYNP